MKNQAWIQMIDEKQATESLSVAYGKCADPQTGEAANIMKIHSLNPQSMLDHRAMYRTLMFGPSPLRRYQREMIGLVVSTLNHCRY